VGTKRWIAVLAVVALAGCGGGSDDAASTTTAKEASTTTTEAGPSSSPVTDAATLTAADMGGDWIEYPDKPKSETGGEKTCADTDTTHAFDTVVAAGDGKILQKGKLERYVQTSTWVFDSPAEAQAFATSRLTDAWIECVRAQSEAALTEEPVQTVKAYGVTREHTGSSVGQYALEFDQEIDGKQQYGGAFAVHTLYVKGKVVIDQFYQAIQRSDTDPKGLDDTISNELNTGIDKVLGRVPA